MNAITITALWRYPVKGLAGESLQASTIGDYGLSGDRQWAIMRPNHHPLTQRQCPKMAILSARETTDGIALITSDGERFEVSKDSLLPGTLECHIWKDRCRAHLAPDEVGRWLQRQLGWPEALRVVRCASENRQFINPDRFKVETVYFSDAAPLLVCNESSLQALNAALAARGAGVVDMRNFRPNIVVSGPAAFEEHHLERIQLPEGDLSLIDHCQRCAVISVDPDQGEAIEGAPPFHALTEINPMPKVPAPAFGVNAVWRGKSIELKVGDRGR